MNRKSFIQRIIAAPLALIGAREYAGDDFEALTKDELDKMENEILGEMYSRDGINWKTDMIKREVESVSWSRENGHIVYRPEL